MVAGILLLGAALPVAAQEADIEVVIEVGDASTRASVVVDE